MAPSGMSHTPCHCHTLLTLVMLFLLISTFSTLPRILDQEGNWASPNFMHHVMTSLPCINSYFGATLLKAKPKQWPNLNLDYVFHASTHMLEISLAHVKKVKSP